MAFFGDFSLGALVLAFLIGFSSSSFISGALFACLNDAVFSPFLREFIPFLLFHFPSSVDIIAFFSHFFLSDEVLNSHRSTGRSLLQAKNSIDFLF
jgi:hypothetical protein